MTDIIVIVYKCITLVCCVCLGCYCLKDRRELSNVMTVFLTVFVCLASFFLVGYYSTKGGSNFDIAIAAVSGSLAVAVMLERLLTKKQISLAVVAIGFTVCMNICFLADAATFVAKRYDNVSLFASLVIVDSLFLASVITAFGRIKYVRLAKRQKVGVKNVTAKED